MQVQRWRLQCDVLVREVEHFDIADGIRAVRRQTPVWATVTVPFGLKVMSYSSRFPENTAVSTSAIPSLSFLIVADDAQLGRIDRAVEHAGGQRRHLLVQGRAAAGMLGIVGGEDADLHVQPLVAVDDVVAGHGP